MSNFYSTSSDQRDTAANLCSRDPEHASYDSIPSNMLYLNYSSSAVYSETLPGNAQCQRSGIGLPVATTILPQEDPRMSLRAQFGFLNGQNLYLQQPNISSMQNQGLSLSLGTQIPISSFQYRQSNSDISFIGPNQQTPGNGGSFRDETFQDKISHGNVSSYGLTNLASSMPNSKYLKAAQELLDEVVNVRTALKQKTDKSQTLPASAGVNTGKDTSGGSKSESMPSNPQDSTVNSSDDLSPSERLDLQSKVTKLLAMLDEVDRRYKQYYHQMQIIVSSFDAIAGFGAAKPYTALALQTISRHYRCLKDAISDQIQATRKILGEQDNSSSKGGGLSRLRYIDQQLRQQRAMQQFGMMQQHAWRPQRGLPESSVSILRAWLFEHFLHPYPKDSEKLMLARQTGLTRSQVSNWFINARVRLWKPMIEDMYKEEIGDTEMDSNSSSDNPHLGKDGGSSKDREDFQNPRAERCQTSQFCESSRTNMVSTMDMTEPVSGYQTEGTADAYMNLKLIDQRPMGEDSTFLEEAFRNTDGGGRFMAYQMAELGRFGSNNGVSLTLGLQHSNGGGLLVTDDTPNFLGGARGNDIYGAAAAAPVGADAADHEYISMGDQRHRYPSSHLLHDFVA